LVNIPRVRSQRLVTIPSSSESGYYKQLWLFQLGIGGITAVTIVVVQMCQQPAIQRLTSLRLTRPSTSDMYLKVNQRDFTDFVCHLSAK
jgi:hypothetical protein